LLPLPSRSLITLALAALIPRALLAVFLGVVGEPERWEYDVIAANIVAGSGHVYDRFGFVYAAYAPPLWSWMLAAVLVLAGEARIAIQILQAFLCLGAAIICGGLARRISGDETAGLLAGLLVAVQPSLLYYSVVKSDPLPLNVLLLGLIAAAATSLIEAPSDRRALVFGGLTGLGVLSRGTPVVALPVVVLALFTRSRSGALRTAAVSTLAMALCLAPWLVRNTVLLGAPVLTSTTGENFWRGNHEGAGGGVLDLDGGRITLLMPLNAALPPSVRAVLAAGTEMQRHEVFMSEAWRFISTKPGEAVGLFATKMRTFWWRIDSDPSDYPRTASIAYEVIYRSELALALFGAFVLFRPRDQTSTLPDRWVAAPVLAIIIAVSLLQSAFYVQGRHRFLIEPLLLMFTAIGISALRGWGSGRKRGLAGW
jgi:hypothetical protein